MRNGFSTLLEIVQGNYGFNLSFTLQDSTGATVDITDANLSFTSQLDSDDTVQFSNPMVVVSGIAGTCYYTVQQTDFPIAGTWNAQIVATFTEEVLTWSGIVITVDSQLPI